MNNALPTTVTSDDNYAPRRLVIVGRDEVRVALCPGSTPRISAVCVTPKLARMLIKRKRSSARVDDVGVDQAAVGIARIPSEGQANITTRI